MYAAMDKRYVAEPPEASERRLFCSHSHVSTSLPLPELHYTMRNASCGMAAPRRQAQRAGICQLRNISFKYYLKHDKDHQLYNYQNRQGHACFGWVRNLSCRLFVNKHPLNWTMYTKSWHVIKDDAKHTFEVVAEAGTDNAFTNKTYAMQKAGMNVTCILLPVTNKHSSKDIIKFTGYTPEHGLYQRLLKQHHEITLKQSGFWEE